MPFPFQFGRVKSAFGGEELGVVPGEEVGELYSEGTEASE
jgi:hypothetical protein